jgi:hypothetical protein
MNAYQKRIDAALIYKTLNGAKEKFKTNSEHHN